MKRAMCEIHRVSQVSCRKKATTCRKTRKGALVNLCEKHDKTHGDTIGTKGVTLTTVDGFVTRT